MDKYWFHSSLVSIRHLMLYLELCFYLAYAQYWQSHLSHTQTYTVHLILILMICTLLGGLQWPVGTFQQNGLQKGGNLQLNFTDLNATNGLEMFYNSTNAFHWEGTHHIGQPMP